jgi:hypothetical protein
MKILMEGNEKRKMTKTVLSILIASCLLTWACGAGGSKATTGITGTKANTVSYPETTDGLKRLTEDILAATKAGDKTKVSTLVKSLEISDYEAWFNKTFGSEKGAKLSADYRSHLNDFETSATELFIKMVAEDKTEVRVSRFDKAGNSQATGAQNQALGVMKEPVPLYSVRMVRPGEDAGMHLWSFIYADGSFRFVGKLPLN